MKLNNRKAREGDTVELKDHTLEDLNTGMKRQRKWKRQLRPDYKENVGEAGWSSEMGNTDGKPDRALNDIATDRTSQVNRIPQWLQPGPAAGSGYSEESYECIGCGYAINEGYKKDSGKENFGFTCPNCGGTELIPLEDNPPMSARDRYAKTKTTN